MPVPHFSNPGISGIDELSSAEEAVVASIASLGSPTNVLAVNGAGDGVEWVAAGGFNLTVQEQDGTPTVTAVDTIVFTNGTVTDDGAGQVSVSITGGGGVATSGTPVANDFARFTDASTIEGRSYSEVRSDLGLVIGTNVQAYDAGLASIAGLTTAADRMIYTTALDTYATTPLTAAARSILDDASTSAIRTTLGVGTAQSPQFAGLNIGSATDTTITRDAAGQIAVEGVRIPTISSTNTITNKTMDGDNNTFSNLDIGNEVDWAAVTDVADRTAFTSGDKLLIFEVGVGLRKIDFDDLPGGAAGDLWSDPVDADIVPDADGTRDLGSSVNRFAEVHTDRVFASNWQAIIGGPSQLALVSNNGTIFAQFSSDNLGASDSPVNYPELSGSTTGSPVRINAFGTDTNIDLNLIPEGSGEVQVSGQKIIDETDTASTTAAGITELATTAEVDTGTDTGRVVTPDALAGSYAGKKSVGVLLVAPGTDVATGTSQAFFTIPEDVAGMNLISVHAEHTTAGTTGVTTYDINKNGTSMLSTKLTVDSAETGSDTAAAAAVIDATQDDVAENDVITIDVDGVSTTAPQGAFIRLTFQLP